MGLDSHNLVTGRNLFQLPLLLPQVLLPLLLDLLDLYYYSHLDTAHTIL